MDIIKKLQILLNNVEKIQNEEDREIYKDIITRTATDCAEYVKCVVNLENCISILRFTLEVEDFQTSTKEYDSLRRAAHNEVIHDIRLLNKLCLLLDLPKIYEGDKNDRIEIAEFAKIIVNEFFDKRKK